MSEEKQRIHDLEVNREWDRALIARFKRERDAARQALAQAESALNELYQSFCSLATTAKREDSLDWDGPTLARRYYEPSR